MGTLTSIAPRRLEALVPQLMADEPVVVLVGARTVGKSTLLRRLAEPSGAIVLDLDDLTTRGLVRDDLSFYAGGPSPVLVDEFQRVPELLDAIKAELNVDPRPGRFLLTGSTRYSALPRAAQSLTGRVHVVTVWPLSQGEIASRPESFVERLLDESASAVSRRTSTATRADYAERVLTGGLPAALKRASGRSRSRWYEGYVNLVVERDVLDIRDIRQGAVLRSCYTAYRRGGKRCRHGSDGYPRFTSSILASAPGCWASPREVSPGGSPRCSPSSVTCWSRSW